MGLKQSVLLCNICFIGIKKNSGRSSMSPALHSDGVQPIIQPMGGNNARWKPH